MATSNTTERLHKRIANAGLCSRRAAEEMIRQGRVEVNGQIVTEMGVKVEPEDVIAVDGVVLNAARLMYLIMNKPAGYLTTMSDPHRRPTVLQLLPRLDVVLKPCGRLDQDTEGLLIFTNDGQFAQHLTHPSHAVEKEYVATVQGLPSEVALKSLREGVYIEGGKTGAASVTVEHMSDQKSEAILRIVIHEGRKRQVRQMCESVGHPVKSLKRVRIGTIVLHKLPRGACRMLSKVEVDKLKSLVGLSGSGGAAPKARAQKPADFASHGSARRGVRPRAAAPKRRTKPSS